MTLEELNRAVYELRRHVEEARRIADLVAEARPGDGDAAVICQTLNALGATLVRPVWWRGLLPLWRRCALGVAEILERASSAANN